MYINLSAILAYPFRSLAFITFSLMALLAPVEAKEPKDEFTVVELSILKNK